MRKKNWQKKRKKRKRKKKKKKTKYEIKFNEFSKI